MGNERVAFEQAADGLLRGALQAHQDPKLAGEHIVWRLDWVEE